MHSVAVRNSKGLRQESLRQILAENRVFSQDEVVDRMLALGFHVTQSSISRDFKELGVVKVSGRYTASPLNSKLGLGQFVMGTAEAGANLFVIKTQSGWASAISEAMDFRGIDGVAGTIAGENTIFVATQGEHVFESIREFLAGL